VRASSLVQETVVSPRGYFVQPNEREAQDVIARVYIRGRPSPRIEEE